MSYDPYKSQRLDDLNSARSDGAPGRAEAGAVMTRFQREMEKRIKIPILEIQVTLWWLVVPVVGMFTGGACGKLATALLDRALDLEGLGSLIGIGGAVFMWLRLKNTLGFVKFLAIFMAAFQIANATNSVLNAWEWDMFLLTILCVWGVFLTFPLLPGWLAKWRGAELKAVQQWVCLGTLALVGSMILPLGWFIHTDPYSILLGTDGVLGLGSWGGFVVAELWYLALWNWGE